MTIQELLSDAGIEFVEAGGHHHARTGWIQLRECPFCSSDKYHLGYNIAFNYCACWRCGWHSAYSTLKKLGIRPHLLKQLDVDEDSVADKQERTGLKEPSGRGPLLPIHERYLRMRGLDPQQITQLWQAEGIGVAARLSWRIYIPILQRGKRVSWTTRAIGEKVEQRYISASAGEESVNHKHVVYGLDYVRDVALVVEGPFDAWNVGPGAVCLFGTAYSAAQVKQLSQVPNRYVCFDNSYEAQSHAWRLAGELSCFAGRTQVLEMDADDPGSASRKEITRVRKAIGL